MGSMSDAFVPEADALDQHRNAVPEAFGEEDELEAAIEYPRRIPIEAPESDVLEQAQVVDFDDDER